MDSECNICSECLFDPSLNQDVSALLCGHTFHKCCLDKWWALKKECPNCRTVFRRKIDKLYFDNTKDVSGSPQDADVEDLQSIIKFQEEELEQMKEAFESEVALKEVLLVEMKNLRETLENMEHTINVLQSPIIFPEAKAATKGFKLPCFFREKSKTTKGSEGARMKENNPTLTSVPITRCTSFHANNSPSCIASIISKLPIPGFLKPSRFRYTRRTTTDVKDNDNKLLYNATNGSLTGPTNVTLPMPTVDGATTSRSTSFDPHSGSSTSCPVLEPHSRPFLEPRFSSSAATPRSTSFDPQSSSSTFRPVLEPHPLPFLQPRSSSSSMTSTQGFSSKNSTMLTSSRHRLGSTTVRASAESTTLSAATWYLVARNFGNPATHNDSSFGKSKPTLRAGSENVSSAQVRALKQQPQQMRMNHVAFPVVPQRADSRWAFPQSAATRRAKPRQSSHGQQSAMTQAAGNPYSIAASQLHYCTTVNNTINVSQYPLSPPGINPYEPRPFKKASRKRKPS